MKLVGVNLGLSTCWAQMAYSTNNVNPMPTAFPPLLAIATMSMIVTPTQKPVWIEFIMRKVWTLSESRAKRMMARMSMSRTATMRTMKRTTTLKQVCQCTYENDIVMGEHTRRPASRSLQNRRQ